MKKGGGGGGGGERAVAKGGGEEGVGEGVAVERETGRQTTASRRVLTRVFDREPAASALHWPTADSLVHLLVFFNLD